MSYSSQTSQQSITNSLSIRAASYREMPKIASFIRSSSDWYENFVSEKDMDEHNVGSEWIEKNYRRRSFYLGNNGKEDVGTISFQRIGNFAYLGYIYLNVDHVGKGYGHELMEFAKAEAKRQGLKGLVLIAHPEAKWAVKAYLKFGFKVIARSKDEVLKWQDGALVPYYEEGFHLYQLMI
ncbi:MAG: GNAT family N-acetyltransferase [Bdellovibrionota bacterium]